MDISVLKAEHSALAELRQQLLDLVNRETPAGAEISAVRWRFSRLLLAHLAKEDSHLYPLLKADPNAPAAALAARYEREMGDLSGRWHEFIMGWTAQRIAADWIGFRAAALPILDALATRIQCEERDLYPRFESIQLGGSARLAS
jgi:hypothetical protein